MVLADQLQRDEGLRLHPYVDPVGKVTIGVGRNLTDVGITYGEATVLLYADISHVLDELSTAFRWWDTLSDVRQRAIANLHFNVGATRFRTFVLLIKALERHDYADAAHELRTSRWAGQVGARAERVATALATGLDP
jgi:lysozyme